MIYLSMKIMIDTVTFDTHSYICTIPRFFVRNVWFMTGVWPGIVYASNEASIPGHTPVMNYLSVSSMVLLFEVWYCGNILNALGFFIMRWSTVTVGGSVAGWSRHWTFDRKASGSSPDPSSNLLSATLPPPAQASWWWGKQNSEIKLPAGILK